MPSSWGFFFLSFSSSCFFSSHMAPKVQPVVSRSSLATVPSGMSREDEAGRSHSTKKGPFHEIFNLPESERPLAGEETYYSQLKIHYRSFLKTALKSCELFCVFIVCENGWRCCLINRDRKMPTDYIRNGVLYVTEKYVWLLSLIQRFRNCLRGY